MKTVKHFGFLSLLLLSFFWGLGSTVYASPQVTVPSNSHSHNEIKLKKLLNKEGIIFNFHLQEFEAALQLFSLDKGNSKFWLFNKGTKAASGELSAFELQYVNYSKNIELSLDSLTMIFPFHTYI